MFSLHRTPQSMYPALLPSRIFTTERIINPLKVLDSLAREEGQTLKVKLEISHACPFRETELPGSIIHSKVFMNPKRIQLVDLPVTTYSDTWE